MGGGVGAGVGIDKEPSPRRAAIEKAQAELRQEVAVREERRRELEFLEKGGNPLDFKFGDTSAIGLQFLPPTDPLAEQNLTSEAKGRFGSTALPNGDFGESVARRGSFLGRGSNTGGSLLPLAGDIETLDSEGNVAQAGQTPHLDGNQSDPHRKESEDSGGIRLGVKSQAYARRNRPRSNNFNGHLSLRDTDKAGTLDGSSTVSTGMKGLIDAKEADADILSDKNRNISLITIAKAISLYRTGMTKTSSCKEHLGPDLDEKQKQDAGKDMVKENLPVIEASAGSEQVQSHEHPAEVGFDPVVNPTISEAAVAAEEVENQVLSLVADSEAVNKAEGTGEKEVDQNLNDGHYIGRSEGENSSMIGVEGSHLSSQSTRDAVDKLSTSETNPAYIWERQGIDETAENVRILIPDKTPESRNLDTTKESTTTKNTDLHGSRTANSILESKSLMTSDIKVKIEQVLPEKGVVVQAEGEKISNVQDLKDLSPTSREEKIDSQSGGVTSFQSGATCSLTKVSSSSGASSSKNTAVVLPWEKEKDPTVVVEAERHKANLSAAAKKAHEDIILEEAEAKKAILRRNAEWARRKPVLEPLRRKSHWDFVLEEMAWLANDFMQERLWKITAAAQVCRWVAQERGQSEFHVRELQQRQKEVAFVLATAVNKYWQSVEMLICRDKHVANLQLEGNTSSRSQKNPNDGEAVPMEIDQSINIEAHKKELEAETVHSKRRIPVQDYAIRFIKDTKGIGGLIQTKAPSTLERSLDAGILEAFWENKFPEESLFYSVPYGAMEAYRNSVYSYWASLEIQGHTAVLPRTDAQVGSEGSDEALGLLEYGMSGFANDIRAEVSPRGRGFGGDEDEMRIQYLPGAFEGSKASVFARKKRKKIMKASMPKHFEGRTPPGVYHRFSMGNNAENDSVSPPPLMTGKRSSSNLNVGVIPTKRIRSSTVAARRAAGTPNAGAVIPSGLANKADVSSGDTSSQQEAFNTSVVLSQPRKTTDIDSTGACGNHFIGADTSFRFKKKKKSKPFGAVISSITRDTGGSSGPPAKGSEPEHIWQQDVVSQHEQREQSKRKVDSNSRICDTSLGVLGTTSDLQLSNSHGLVHAAKKLKLSKHLLDSSPEVVTPTSNSTLSPGASQMSNMSNANKVIRQIGRGRKNKAIKAAPNQIGMGIPWSTIEDQALVVLVHDVGPNWELVSDIINSSLQIKAIFRKPMDCKERHKCLMERTAGDGGDSPEDSGSSQPYPSTLPGIPKGSARLLLQRLQGPMEEDTLKIHLERIVQVGQQQCSRKIQNDCQEQKQRAQVHPSHVLAMSQICSNSSSGRLPTPLDLCDETPSNSEISHTYQLSPLATGLAMPNILGTASGIQPTSAGISFSQGTKSNMQLGTGLIASSGGLSAGAARDGQRFASVRRASVAMDEPQQRLQQYNQMVAGRSLQSSVVAGSAGVPIMSLPSSNDCGVSMLAAGNGAGMMCGLSRGLSLSRSGFPGIGSPGISGMVSSGMSSMLPSSGVGLPMSGGVASGTIHAPGNFIRRSRDMQMLQPGQEPRQMLKQELQLHGSQSNGQAAASFNSGNSAFPNQMVSATNQNFSGQQQHHQKSQQQQGHGNQHYPQPQNSNHNQAYMQAVRQLQHQQQNRFLQPQQQFPANSSLLPQSQPHPLSHTQHTMTSQPQILSQENQQQSILSQHVHQPQTTPQPQSTSQSSPTLQQPSLQHCGASSMNPTLLQNPQQQQSNLSQTSGQSSQVVGQSKTQQQNQIQKQQQQQTKVSKGLGRDGVLLQNTSPQPGQVNGLQVVPGNSLSPQMQAQQVVHSGTGQKMFPGLGLHQLGKQMPQSVMTGKQGQLHGQGSGHEPVSLSHVSTTLCQQQKGFSQQSSSKQQTSQGSSQQQIPSTSATSHQVLVPSPPSAQQMQMHASEQQTSSIPTPLLASSSQQQQRSMQSQHAAQRRLPQRQSGSAVGLQAPPQLGKDCMQQQSQVTSQLPCQPGHSTFQLGTNVGSPLSMAASSVAPFSSTLNSSTTPVHSATWKAGQNIPQITGGLYNLSRSSSASTAQIPPVASSSGVSVTLSNGNVAVPTAATSGLMSHGVNLAGLPPQQSAGPIGLVHEHKAGTFPAMGTRAVQQMGGKRSPQQSQYQQQHIHNEMQSSITSSLASSQTRSPTSGSMPSTVGAGISIRPPYHVTSVSMTGQSMSGPIPAYNNVQLRQAHAGQSHVQGAAAHTSIGPSTPSLISADIPGASSVLDSGLPITSVATVTTPSTSSQ
eukprot:Gb_31226 [translate_table: standard]